MIIEKDADDLVRAIKAGKSRFAFFIGAGASKDAGIPLSSTLIEQWRREQYEFQPIDSSIVEPFEDWVSGKEAQLDQEDSKYGFWFEQRHPAREDRRSFIEQIAEKVTPTFGLIALAAAMAEGWIPVTLTTNFDDLLYDSFYLFLEQKPLLINHDALAPQMRITLDRPKIVKLHGDYLYDNLKNTGPECERLAGNMAKTFSQCLGEYGLVVVGYGGQDRSIMDILSALPPHCLPYGLWWCILDSTPPDEPPQLVRALLEKDTNRFLVRIPGAEDLLLRLWSELEIRSPREKEIQDRTDARLQILRRALALSKTVSSGRSRGALTRHQQIERLWSVADSAITRKDYNKAIEAYDKAIELDPQDGSAYSYRGWAYTELTQYKRAITDLDKAIELNPQDDSAYTNRGWAYVELKQYERAISDCDRAIELAPQDAVAYINRGIAYGGLKQHERAISDFDRVIELDPEDTSGYINRGSAHADSKQYERAISDFDRVIELDPQDAVAYASSAEVLLVTGKVTSAKEWAAHSLEHAKAPNDRAAALMLLSLAQYILDGEKMPSQYRALCSQEFHTNWDFTVLDNWLASVDLEPNEKAYVKEVINLLRQH